jgi:hypothetical protein
MEVRPITREVFDKICGDLKIPSFVVLDDLYSIYESVCDGIENLANLSKTNEFSTINHFVLILYIVNEYAYTATRMDRKKFEEIKGSEAFLSGVASRCADKYLTNEQLNYKSRAFLDRFTPPISTIELFLNFCLRSLETSEARTKEEKLVLDMLTKAFKLSKCILTLLLDGFETEAFSTWRTLHENECILIVLIKHPKEVMEEYFKHITYALAYRGQFKDKAKVDAIFNEIKSEMKRYELKSKDMKKYIEYGYLLKIPNVKLNEDIKLNFRDGVEKMAGLSDYSGAYETASEIAHSSPILLFSRRDYFFSITMINIYESFFRLENIFRNFYGVLKGKEALQLYDQMRQLYGPQLNELYGEMKRSFHSPEAKNEEKSDE